MHPIISVASDCCNRKISIFVHLRDDVRNVIVRKSAMRCQSIYFAFFIEWDGFIRQWMSQMMFAVGIEMNVNVMLVLKSSERQDRKFHISNYELDGNDQTGQEFKETSRRPCLVISVPPAVINRNRCISSVSG